jgi:hypothetical protein
MQNTRRVLPVVVVILLLHLLITTAMLAPFDAPRPLAPASLDLSVQPNPPDLATLVQQADQIVRGRVAAVHSFWNERHTQIESTSVIDVRYTIFGTAVNQVTVRTEGGYLASEGLGMKSTNTATFAPGEDVLVLLKSVGTTYEVVENEAGKYAVLNGLAVNPHLRTQAVLSDLLPVIATALTTQGRSSLLPADWQQRELGVGSAGVLREDDFVYENLRWAGDDPNIRLKININTDEANGSDGSVTDFTNAIVGAAATWSLVPNAALGLLYDGPTTATDLSYNGVNEVIFFPLANSNVAGRTRLWFNQSRTILEADFWLNNAMEWDATANPSAPELDVQSASLHELGHWLGLGHDSDPGAVMYASLTTGTTKRQLHANDVAGISFIYPCANAPCIPPEYATPVITPTLTTTATPTPTSTGISTQTATPALTATTTATPSAMPSVTATRTPTPTLTATVTATPTQLPTAQPTTAPGRTDAAQVYLPLVQK